MTTISMFIKLATTNCYGIFYEGNRTCCPLHCKPFRSGFWIFSMVTLGTFQGMGAMITVNGGGFRA